MTDSQIKTLCRRLRWMLRTDPRAIEIISAAAAIGWAVGVLIGDFARLVDYVRMAEIAPPLVWALGVGAGGVGQWVAALWGRPKLRESAAMGAGMIWGAMTALTLAADALSPGSFIFAVLALANAWGVAQIARE